MFRPQGSLDASTNLQELPDELFLHIFSYVPDAPQTCARLCLVNKRVNRIATPLLYKSFSSGNEKSCIRFAETIATRTALARHVHVLHWLGVTDWEEDEADELLTKVLTHQPNLRHVTWRNEKCFVDSDTDSDYWTNTEADLETAKRRSVMPFREGWGELQRFSSNNIFRNLQSADLAMRRLRLSEIIWLMRIPTLQKLWLDAVLRYDSEDRILRSLSPQSSSVQDFKLRLSKRPKPSLCDIASIVVACRSLTNLSLSSQLSESTNKKENGTLQELKTAVELHSPTLKTLEIAISGNDLNRSFLPKTERLERFDIAPGHVPWPLIRTIRQLPRTIRAIHVSPGISQSMEVLLKWPTYDKESGNVERSDKVTVYLCEKDVLYQRVTFDHWQRIKRAYASQNVALKLTHHTLRGGYPWGRAYYVYGPPRADEEDRLLWAKTEAQN
ncbi:hypothetical protein T440DRAFT_469143, partial [Plenodomus tracheiphilus IPT5]